jgi:transcription-repair coupling factor (superfamily II helicase)
LSLLTELSARLQLAPVYARALATLGEGGDVTLAVPSLLRPLLVAAQFSAAPRPTLVVVSGEEEAARFARQLDAYLPKTEVLRFPLRREQPWSREPADAESVGRRARAVHALQRACDCVVVASARSLLRKLPPSGGQVFDPLVLEAGGALDLTEAAERLARMGYEHTDAASERSTFAVRGGVLDIFPSDAVFPVRAELFGDEIESLRRYVPSTGQSTGEVEGGRAEVFPCREVRLGKRAASNARKQLGDKAIGDAVVGRDLELIEQGVYFPGVEEYLPVFYQSPETLTDYLHPSALIVVMEPRSLFDDAARYYDEVTALAEAVFRDPARLYIPPAKLDLGGRQRLTLLSLLRAGGATDGEIVARRPDVSGGEDKLAAGLRSLLDVDYRVVLAARDRDSRVKVARTLVDHGLTVTERGWESSPLGSEEVEDGHLGRGVVAVTVADIPAGYVVPDARLAVVSVDDVYPRTGRRDYRGADVARSLSFDFKPGDYVVHATHGVALFREMTRKAVLGAERDYLLLEYAKGDKLYVPVEQLDRVTRYVGPDQAAPRVTRLNTADWSKATGKARKAAKQLAFDLVDLYARRSTVSGFTYGPDTEMQREMEALFPFEETPDQLAAIADVKADMESGEPMDRLVCGDVGYGKTEVAIRAVFKATQDGKQVMVLCPTTILAQQHFTTFSERYAPFPVRVEVLSRFRSKAQQEEALAGFAAGTVDVLIGTHRLLSRDVTPHDLGLVVVDEEQRFGVEHKEHLKNLREQVDVLTLTATPIPRTLQMSLSGVRDMSIIDTPPPNRFPVKVHVGEYDPEVVGGAIRRELERGGQVYYISNRVKSIDTASKRVHDAVPEARVAVAHGQMSEHQLEREMERFSAGEVDVLVSTTIIESGIDNPHTNTLVIEDSERLGLAQLYQLKGRVGRSHVRAFAYFLFPANRALTEQAIERLTAIGEATELGGGLKVAMRDLEIRGAGSLLGAEQHGQMSAVGFELYAQMLREAVAEVRGEPAVAFPEIRVDLPVPAFLPAEYVPDVDDRVRYYRRLAGSVTPEGVAKVAEDLRARFGAMPEAARNLAAAARIKAIAAEVGATSVAVVRGRVTVAPLSLTSEQRGRLGVTGAIYNERDRKATFPAQPGQTLVEATLSALDAILTAVDTSTAPVGGNP